MNPTPFRSPVSAFRFPQLLAFLSVTLTALTPILAQTAPTPPPGPPPGILAPENLHAWCVVPFDAKKRGPEERAQMLEKLGFKRFVYDWRAKDIPTFDAEIEALKKHGIELTAWWSPGNSRDPVLLQTLEVFKRQNVHPQLWVMGGGTPTTTPEEQRERVEKEAERIRDIVKLAEPYGCPVELYNHNNWFGQPDNEVAIIEQLKQFGVTNVGMIYNFSHGHEDVADFPAIWKRIQPYVRAVNVTGMTKEGEKKIVPPSQGEFELGMLRVILDSGWRGPIGLIAEQGGDAEITLGNNLRGLDWCRQELAQPGAAGPRPTFPPPTR
jgi:sugar phosphate isomerase/epimerase